MHEECMLGLFVVLRYLESGACRFKKDAMYL